MLHGLCQLSETYQIIPTEKKWFKKIGHIYTLLIVVITFVLFRADTLSQGFGIIKNMFTGASGISSINSTILACINPLFIICFIFSIIVATPVFSKIRKILSKMSCYKVYNRLTYAGSIVLFIVCILLLVSSKYNPFIYFIF